MEATLESGLGTRGAWEDAITLDLAPLADSARRRGVVAFLSGRVHDWVYSFDVDGSDIVREDCLC